MNYLLVFEHIQKDPTDTSMCNRFKIPEYTECKRLTTYQQYQDTRVLCVVLRDLNKSRKSPSRCLSQPLSGSSGIGFLLHLATLRRAVSACSTFPFTSNQRTDSGEKLNERDNWQVLCFPNTRIFEFKRLQALRLLKM